MEYTRFVRLRRPLWEGFERGLAEARRPRQLSYAALEELAIGYRQVLHDHALAAARYPGTSAARWLGALALEGTHRLTVQEGRRGGGLRRFFLRTFPRAFRRQLDLLAVAAGLFVLAALLGLLLGAVRPALGIALLGPEAVKGLSEGRLWTDSLATTVPPAFSSSRIATNNLGVALVAWTGGGLGGLVPLYVILLNGFMLGSAFAIVLHYSLGGALLTFVVAHGPLELTLVVVTAASGLGIGRALVAAGDRPRGEALRAAGRDALAVLLGALPWFLLLGAVEALISPSPEIPFAVKLAVGCGLEVLFLSLALRPPAPGEDEDD